MQDWVAQALDRMQPVLDGKVVVGVMAEDYHQEMMTAIMEDVEWLVQHFKVLPEPCHQDHSKTFKAGLDAYLRGSSDWDVHPYEEDEG
jgi:hypothetical protein